MTVEHHRIRDRPSWLEMRRRDLTASDLGAVAGVDAYRSPLSVFVDKLGRSMVRETKLMARGRWLEHGCIAAVTDLHPELTIFKPAVYLRDPEIRLGCTPDCLAEDPADPGLINIQCKTIARPSFDKWQGQIPLSYGLQTVAEGMLTGARMSYLAVLVISTYDADLEMFPIPRNELLEAKIRRMAVSFWKDFDAGRMPVPDFSRDGEAISALYPNPAAGSVVDLSASNHIRQILEQREELKSIVKAGEQEIEAIDAEIKLDIADHEAATLPGWKITWKQQTRKAYTVPENTNRVLRITRQEED